MEINERVIKIGKSANINTDLHLGNDYELRINVHCQNVRDSDNSDGTIDKIYHLQMLGEIEIENDLGKKTYAKVKGSQSQKWRWKVQSLDENYEGIMNKMIDNSEQVIDFLNKL